MYYMDINTDCANDLKTLATYFEQMGNLTPNIPEDSRTAYCYNMAEYIRLYLQNTCTYTLKPGKLPDNTDMVTYFLTESKQGYCSYFASSAVMMLRAAGIPARLV